MARKTNGAAIRALRDALGIKQVSLAARAGISAPSLCNIEIGGEQPSAATVRRLAEELGVVLDAITYPVPEPVPDPETAAA
jgi:transcriptional regulator with XRE-family HTH domain